MRNKKIKIAIIIIAVILLLGIVVYFVSRDQDDSYADEYQKSENEEAVVYGGKEYVYNDHLSNYLFLGIDTREEIDAYETVENAGQADAIYLLSYDRVEKTVKCISIPRDTMTNIRTLSIDGEDLGMSKDHINIQYAFGDGKTESCQLMKEAVSNLLYGVPIQGYCAVNMDGIPVAVGTLGGVTLIVPDDSLEAVNSKFMEGAEVTITEEDAEQFVRYRDITESQSAIVRMNRQKVFMEAFVETAKTQVIEDNGLIVDIYDSLKPYMVTNMGTDLFAKLLEANYDSENKIQDIPGEKVEGTDFDEYHVDDTQLYELILQVFYEEVQED